MYPRRLVLKGSTNTRELGGYPAANNQLTKYREFLRSADVSACTDDDIALLKEYGVKTVIDLRNTEELKITPNVFATVCDVAYYHISLIPELPDINEIPSESTVLTLESTYINIIENHEDMRRLFRVIIDNLCGVTLFHCTAGKDRTGVTTMLLMMLAGVSIYDITADYEISYTYLMPALILLKDKYPNIPQHLVMSEPEWIKTAYNHIMDKYGNADRYLQSLGFTSDEIDAIRKKICG